MEAYNKTVTTTTNVNLNEERRESGGHRDNSNRSGERQRRHDSWDGDDRRNRNHGTSDRARPSDTRSRVEDRNCYDKERCKKPFCRFLHPEGFNAPNTDKPKEKMNS